MKNEPMNIASQNPLTVFGAVNGWKLVKKLVGLAILGAIPTLLLGALLINEKWSRMSFVKKEVAGLTYLEQVWPVLALSLSEKHDDIAFANARTAVEAAAAQFDEVLDTKASSAILLESLSGDFDASVTIPATQQHIQKIADQSNLILDYELDSIYLILAGTTELPKAISSAQKIDVAIHDFGKSGGINSDSRLKFALAMHDTQVSAGLVVNNLTSAFATTNDAQIKSNIEPRLNEFIKTVKDLDEISVLALGNHSADMLSMVYGEKIEEATHRIGEAADSLWRQTHADLSRTLRARYAALWQSLVFALGGVASLLGFAGLALYFVSRSIKLPISTLVSQMSSLRDGETDFVTPYTELPNEVGDIARALEASRVNAAQLSQARSEIDARLGEETSRSADTGRFLEEISAVVKAAGEGQFGQRLTESGRKGFLFELSRSLNNLLGIVENGIGDTSRVVKSLAGGDVSQRMQGDYKGIFAQLMRDVNQMGDRLRQIAGKIGQATGQVHGATKEIGAGVMDLSSRTEQQASSLEETAASMEELAATVRQNADNAQEANRLAAAARSLAAGGGEIAGRAVLAMDKIEQSSRQVSEIVGLIQEIAFQTNILALNAAVEAARAGEAGRGFAVVANEVRALAQRSAQASKDIKQLIIKTDVNVDEGVELVKQAGVSLTQIVGSVRQVAEIVSEIAAASQEQSSGIDQVSRAITNMDEMTQQNAALVEETNAALHSAQIQVEELRQAVSFFSGSGFSGLVADQVEPGDAQFQAPLRSPANTTRQPATRQIPDHAPVKPFDEVAQRTVPRPADRATQAGSAADPSGLPSGLHDKLRELAQKMAAMPLTSSPASRSVAMPATAREPDANPFRKSATTDWKEF
jgi:methyl-accepting chemotaxis protein